MINPLGILHLFEIISYSLSLKIRSKKSSNESVHSIVISLRESPLSFSADDRVTSGPMLHETSDVCEQVPSNSSESSTSKTAEESRMATSSIPLEDGDTKRREKITRLERRLSRLANLIERLEQKELSLDEMIYSDLYNVEAKLKKRAYEVIENKIILADVYGGIPFRFISNSLI